MITLDQFVPGFLPGPALKMEHRIHTAPQHFEKLVRAARELVRAHPESMSLRNDCCILIGYATLFASYKSPALFPWVHLGTILHRMRRHP